MRKLSEADIKLEVLSVLEACSLALFLGDSQHDDIVLDTVKKLESVWDIKSTGPSSSPIKGGYSRWLRSQTRLKDGRAKPGDSDVCAEVLSCLRMCALAIDDLSTGDGCDGVRDALLNVTISLAEDLGDPKNGYPSHVPFKNRLRWNVA